MELAWIAGGRLRLKRTDAAPVDWDSAFARQVRERDLSAQRRNAWKTEGRGARFAIWGAPMAEDLPSGVTPTQLTAVSRGRRPGEVLYALRTPAVSALLARDPGPEPVELRVFHTADAAISGLAGAADQDKLALAIHTPSGAVNLALLDTDGNRLREVTEGDSVDAAPRWVPGRPGRLVYQSAGIGRDESGLFRGREPFSIWFLDTGLADADALASSPDHDLLRPAEGADGTLYYVRRPFTRPERRGSITQLATDVLFFPFRLLRAIVAWLHLFTVRYTGKPLITTGPPQEGPDDKTLFLLGNEVDVERARRASLQAGDTIPALVPQDWELVRQRRGGAPEVLARAVLDFDLAPDGGVVWTNGNAVFHRDAAGVVTVLAEEPQIQQVAVIG